MPKLSVTRRQLIHVGAAGLAGLSAGAASARPRTPSNTLVVAMAFDDVITLDPAEAFELSTGEILGNCYQRLMCFDVNDPTQLMGELAKSWSVSPDGRTYHFELRDGQRFASGNLLSAADAVFSLQRAVLLDKTPAFILNQFGLKKETVTEKIRQTGRLTLSLETDKPYAPSLVLNCLTANIGAVLDKQLLLGQQQGGDMGHAWLKTQHAGSGPYKLRDWRANEILALERNDFYGGTRPALLRVIYRHVKASSTQRLLLEKGDVDVARNLSPQDIDALAGNKEVKTTATPKGTVYFLSLNMKNPILAKPEVREAMKWLVDYEAIGATLIKNIGVVHQHFLPVGLLGAATDKPYKLDVERARALLAKAGLPQGFKTTLDMRTIQPIQGIAEAIQQTARRAGVVIEIIPGDGKQTLTKYRARAHDMYIGQWGSDYWDPHSNADTFARNVDNSDRAALKPMSWRNSWAIPELTRKSDAAVLERDADKRAKLYREIQKDFIKTSPFVILFQQVEVAAMRSNIQGLKIGPTFDSTYMYKVSKT
jgi:peptide/nickel transport system substrate-binding protein